MVFSVLTHKAPLPRLAVISILLLLCLAACGSPVRATAHTKQHTSSSAHPGKTATPGRPPTLFIVFLDTPTAKKSADGTFTVNGQIQNNDSQQHSVTLQATLLDASGNPLATAIQTLAAPGGASALYTITGTTNVSTWSNVVVSVVKFSGN